MDWKALLKALIAAAVPIIFALLIAKWPDFPLDLDNFLALILWIVGLFIGGWQAKKFAASIKASRKL